MPIRCENCGRPLGLIQTVPGLPHPPMSFCSSDCMLTLARAQLNNLEE